MKSLIVLFTIAFTLLLFTTAAEADVSKCTPVFNGGLSCTQPDNIELDKFIQSSNTFLDNFDPNTRYVNPGQTLTFRISVKNKTNSKINNIKITDTLPQSVEYVNASTNAKYDEDKHTVTYEIDLDSTKSQNLTLAARVRSNVGGSRLCIANQVLAEAQGKKAADNTQFCINRSTTPQAPATNTMPQATNNPPQREQLPQPTPVPVGGATKGGKTLFPTPQNITTNPNTGPETLALFALIPTGISGYLLRKRS